jgi:hypothetical protein
LHRRSFAPVEILVGGGELPADWDPEAEWIPDLDADPELAAYEERPAP